MVEINLLTWRSERELYEKKVIRQFVLAGLIVALLVTGTIHFYLNNLIDQKTRQVALLKLKLPDVSQHEELSSDVVREPIFMEPMTIIKMLQALSDTAQGGVCYQRLTREGNRLWATGRALSLTSVTVGLRQLEAMAFFDGIKLREIKNQTAGGGLQFVIDVGGGQRAAIL